MKVNRISKHTRISKRVQEALDKAVAYISPFGLEALACKLDKQEVLKQIGKIYGVLIREDVSDEYLRMTIYKSYGGLLNQEKD